MKLRESFRFPYPVLTETSSDYLADQIDLSLSIDEAPSTGALKIAYTLGISSETIMREVSEGRAKCFLSIVCRDSFYNEFADMESLDGKTEINGGLLFGRVDVRAIVVQVVDGYLEATGIPGDYASSKFELTSGAVLAWTLPQSFTVGHEKLAPMESIFKLALDETQPEGTFNVSYDEEHITIRAPEKLLATIHAMRDITKARPVALNAIYVPAVMAVLEAFKNQGEFSDRRWHRVISAKAQVLGLDLTNGSSLEIAQRLLKNPAARLTQFMEKFE